MSRRRKNPPRKPRAGLRLVNYHDRAALRVLRVDFRANRCERWEAMR